MNADAEAKEKVKIEKEITTLCVYRSEFTKLENYILGRSAAIITNVGLIVGLGSARQARGRSSVDCSRLVCEEVLT
jgi:PHP family Zn ribbon phosphoesterase